MVVNGTQSSEAISPIAYKDMPVGKYVLRQIEKDEDLILQLNSTSQAVPYEAGAIMAKALIDTFGPAIMDNTIIERMDPKWVEGGSVYVRMKSLNTGLIKDKIDTHLSKNLSASMQEI